MRSLYVNVLLVLWSQMALKECSGTQFTIFSPSMFHIDTEETVVLNLHGYGNSRVRIQAHLQDLPERRRLFSQKDFSTNAEEPISFTMKAGHENFLGAQMIKGKSIEMKILVTSSLYEDVEKSIIIYLTAKSDYMFVQTKRPIYRPGESVQIRVIPLNLQMLPLKNELVKVTVQTPDRIGIWNKSRTFPDSDFVEFTFPISVDPPLGTWFVVAKMKNLLHVSNATAEFKVAKYVLPTFDVNLKVNQRHVKPSEEIMAVVEAKYSYGKPVIGSFYVSASVALPNVNETFEFYTYPTSIVEAAHKLTYADNGVKSFTVPTENIPSASGRSWEDLIDKGATVTIQSSVLATAEGIVEGAATSGIYITKSPYEIDASATSLYFIPSLNQDLTITVRHTVSKAPVPDVPVYITSSEGSGPKTLTTDSTGEVRTVIETRRNSRRINITLKTQHPDFEDDHQATLSFTLQKFRSQSRSYLKISGPSKASVGTEMNFVLRIANSLPSEIRYLVIARGNILLTGRKIRSATEVPLAITTTRKMSPSVRIVAYYLTDDDVVSDSVWVDVSDVCTSRELFIEAPATARPGQEVEIKLTGENGALVGLSAVDRAAYFLNSRGRLSRDEMFRQMNSFDMGCSLSGGKNSLNVFKEAGLAFHGKYTSTAPIQSEKCRNKIRRGVPRSKRSPSNPGNFRTSSERKCYKDGRLANLADETCQERIARVQKWEIDETLGTETRKKCTVAFRLGCRHGDIMRRIIARLGRTSGTAVDRMSSFDVENIRSNFQENWIWSSVTLRQNGIRSISHIAPHSITTYDIDAVGVHDTEGFCIAKPAKVTVFKDIFIQLYLPYSVKVNEQVQIHATVFNYHSEEIRQLELRIKVDENFCTPYEPGKWSSMATLAVANQSSASFSFTGTPMKVPELGTVEIKLMVNSTVDNIMDGISKSLRVEEPGTIEEFSGSFELDPSLHDSDHVIYLSFSDENIVPDTKKCWIYGYMSFLGPIIEFDPISETPNNLADSIKVPYGCGEQNMMVCGPNVFAFKYLKDEGNDKPNTVEQIQKYIIDGYTRQQTHRNSGVWSVYSNYSPTIWLNAYVDKVFLHARTIWSDMNMGPICDSIKWIIRQQDSDGSFSEGTHARYYTVNVALGGEVTLTAYILISLTETEIDCENEEVNDNLETAIDRATTYLQQHVDEDVIPYTAALTAYALTLANSRHSSTQDALQTLRALRTETAKEIFWQSSTPPATIEATSYALLAQITAVRPRRNDVEQTVVHTINKMARWLVRQKNDRGGFKNAQATVVAIQALTEYGRWILSVSEKQSNPHLKLTLTSDSGTKWQNGETMNLDRKNELYKKELVVPTDVVENSRNINVSLSGEGVGSLSYRCIYRITHDSRKCDFEFEVRLEIVDNRPNILKLVIVLSKLTTPDTSMAIIDINLISGYQAVDDTLKRLSSNSVVDGAVDRYEVTQQNVKLYVEKIPGPNEEGEIKKVKLAFNLRQTIMVRNPNPARIHVYDYSNPEVKCSKFYSMPTNSPVIRTTCAPTSVDNDSKECMCLEGGCLKCRTREEQVDKTCGHGRWCFSNCVHRLDCLHLYENICQRNFGLTAKIIGIDDESMPNYVKLEAQIEEVFYNFQTRDSVLKSAQRRKFVIRKDCYEKCVDPQLDKQELLNKNYFAANRTYLIMGRKPHRFIIEDKESYQYYLDSGAIIERIVNAEKCEKYEKHRNRCTNRSTSKCIRIRQLLRICDNIRLMKQRVAEGCDF